MFDLRHGVAPRPLTHDRLEDDLVARLPRHDTFSRRAEGFLRSFTLSEVLDLVRGLEGRWHPTGFMAFHTPYRFGSMPIRVHCWPRGPRRVEDLHPGLHDHMWSLASKVLAGTYAETVYRLEEASDGDYARYAVTYHGRDDATVVEDGTRYRLRPTAERRYAPGDVHHLPAAEFHETTIPDDECVVTVMVTGPRELESCSLIGRPGFPPGRRARTPVTPEQFERAVGDLLP